MPENPKEKNIPENSVAKKEKKTVGNITKLAVFGGSQELDWVILFVFTVGLFLYLGFNATSVYMRLVSKGVDGDFTSSSQVNLREREIDNLIQSFDDRSTVFKQLTGINKSPAVSTSTASTTSQ